MWPHWRRNAGQSLVETALVLPLLFLLFLAIMEIGIVILSYNTVANAAREGARVGMVPGATDPEVIAAARALTGGLDQTQLSVAPPVRTATTIQVTVTYTATLITASVVAALGGSGTVVLQTAATMYTE